MLQKHKNKIILLTMKRLVHKEFFQAGHRPLVKPYAIAISAFNTRYTISVYFTKEVYSWIPWGSSKKEVENIVSAYGLKNIDIMIKQTDIGLRYHTFVVFPDGDTEGKLP